MPGRRTIELGFWLQTKRNFLLFSVLAFGAVELFESGRPVNTWPLDARNIEQLQRWLSRNNEGWNRDFVSYAPRIKVNLKSTQGSPFVLNLMDSTVIVYGAAGQFKQSF